jgi:hypothetical protein
VGVIQRRIIIDRQVVILQSVNWLCGVKSGVIHSCRKQQNCVGSKVSTVQYVTCTLLACQQTSAIVW